MNKDFDVSNLALDYNINFVWLKMSDDRKPNLVDTTENEHDETQ